VEEVVRKLEENNLYVKCKWKIKEVESGVVTELGEIRIKEEKIKMVLEWPTCYDLSSSARVKGILMY